MSFFQRLAAASGRNRSYLCIGLDPDPARLPVPDVLTFNRAVIEATADLACCYKPNAAFFEALGPQGWEVLVRTVEAVPDGIPVVLDAKRGDIGSTAAAYARAAFDVLGADAVTASPYLGEDALAPFLEWEDRGVYVLCRTSNPGARDVQDLRAVREDGTTVPLYLAVAERARGWNRAGNVGLVVGATYPEEMRAVRAACPELPFLVPGVGAQGGDLAAAVGAALDAEGGGFVIAVSRQVLYAGSGREFAAAARAAARELRDAINRHREAALAARRP
ncbi:MAG TPA: orotidine-5'-phosphate decarboxylase [Dehalococcoidia bacterium]